MKTTYNKVARGTGIFSVDCSSNPDSNVQYKILHSGLLAHGAQAVFSFIVLCAPRASPRHENPAQKI